MPSAFTSDASIPRTHIFSPWSIILLTKKVIVVLRKQIWHKEKVAGTSTKSGWHFSFVCMAVSSILERQGQILICD